MYLLGRWGWIAMLVVVAFTGTAAVPALALAQSPRVGRPMQGQGMSTRKKLLLLAGAAGLYWLYKRHQNSRGTGPQGRYYRSRNGRIYYRDAQGRAHWVTPPPASRPIQVPVDEYERYVGRLPSGYERAAGSNRVLTAPPGSAYR